MNEPRHDGQYAYRSYHSLQNYLRMTFRMHQGIFRTLFAIQITLIAILFLFALSSPLGPWDFSLETYFHVLPFTLLIYLLHPLIVLRFRRRSLLHFGEQTRRGPTMALEEELARQLPEGGVIPLTDRISINEVLALQHVLITGSSGTGKTVLLSRAIQSTKARGIKGICHGGKDGEMVARFYEPAKDYIFNPLDQRSIAINIFDFLAEQSDFDSVAATFVPSDATREKFFTSSAKNLLSEILRFAYQRGDRNNAALWHYLNRPRQELHRMLSSIDSPSAVYIEAESPQSQSCLSTLKLHTKVLQYLRYQKSQQHFSLRDWITDEERGGMIFLSSRVKQREALSPLMSFFIDRLATEVLSLRDHPNQIRIIFWVDEWGVLPPMPAIKMLLQQGRSKGSVFVAGIQEKAQLDHIYGPETATSLINQFSTYVGFRMNDSNSAEFFSRLIGERETEQTQASFSSGTRDRRETESYHHQLRSDRLVLAAQLQKLPNLHCFLKVHGYPIIRSELTYRPYPDMAPAFVVNTDFHLASATQTNPSPTAAPGLNIPPYKDENSAEINKRPRFTIDDFDF